MSLHKQQNIVILGLGITGLSCVDYCLQFDVIPKVVDTRAEPPGKDQLPDHVPLYAGEIDQALLNQADLIIASPGIALASPALVEAAANGVEIIGDIELFARAVNKPVIAITGSNGKSTVTSLVGEMAQQAGIKVGVGGNIGVPALSLLKQDCDLYVLELSSFQLETTHSLKPRVATVLNVSEDHMDRYDSFEAYRQAKMSIYQNAAYVLVNRDDPLTFPETTSAQIVSFGTDDEDDYGLQPSSTGFALTKGEQGLLTSDEMQLSGLHNLANVLAALAIADCAGIERQAAIKAAKNYKGLAHRCEFIKQVNGVRWINDSKATNVGATLAAIDGLAPVITGQLHLIAGGDGKGGDFSPLAPAFAERIASVVCFGQDKAEIARLHEKCVIVDDLDAAVNYCAKRSEQGDWVLLSPACASLDMYPNYMARGEHFRQLVEALPCP
ncbi:UDP-N-acetylmuramoyl-L-alanine--D-glutamate ligase [Motilimonas eburnea]|uniref:UDP-N-acetylmuramoyl-L-alanine--D-glutamate ligase n=1 Tax=Motilimonas eburnea TaxID=1737488 RepID=UPI001E2FE51C|nr:UDP-N-acetylmuramoyl-L-alanine--D-glutamate ligase [Motilimonas eburnea]MCE2572069.1 UDP-N-acetylmuramoyl-L-alanine--D-glutamate ligase [Motilimonas eburnea]